MRDLLSPERVWTPSRYQFQTTECGVGSLGMILAHYGRNVPLEEIRAATGVSRDCLNAADVVTGARAFGLDVKVRTCEPERLAEFGFPAIVHLNFIHFVVVEGISDTHILLNDPHAGRREIELTSFDDNFTGVTLTFSPSDTFVPDKRARKPSWWEGLLRGRDGLSLAAAFAAHIGSALALVAVLFAIVSGAPVVAFGGAAAFILGRLASDLVLGRLRARIADRTGRDLTAQMLRLDRASLAYRMPVRLAEVIESAHEMAETLCDRLAPKWFAMGAAPVFLAAILWVHPVAGAAVIAATALFGVIARVVIPWRGGRLGSSAANGDGPFMAVALSLMEPRSWKFGGGDRGLVVDAMSKHAAQSLDRMRVAVSGFAGHILSWMVLPALLFAAILALSGGGASSADEALVLLLTAALGASLRSMPDLRGRWRFLQRKLFDARDLLAAPRETTRAAPAPEIAAGAPALKISNIVFGYSSRRPVLLDGVSLEVREGEHLGVTGPSGGGKSTIGRILAGANEPWSGEAEMFGAPLGPHNHPVWLDKAPVFFEASLRDNLTLWDGSVSDQDILAALDDACLGDEVSQRPDGLDTRVEARGRNFSGGQLQRLEIARAILRAPRVIILDEAVDAMNPAIEARVRENLRKRGITLVVISHRASTLAACDRVVTVVGGRVVDGVKSAPRPAAVVAKAAIDRGHEDTAATPVEGLEAAFSKVCRAAGVTGAPRGSSLTELAASVGVMFRSIQFKTLADWRHERPPLIALPDGNPARAIAGNATPRADDMVVNAVQIYDVNAVDANAPATTIIARACRSAYVEIARMAGAGLLAGGVIALSPRMAAGASPSWFAAAVATALAAGGLGLLIFAAALAALRTAHRAEQEVMFALVAKCRKQEMAPLQRMPRYIISGALRFVGEMATRIQDTALPAVIATGMMAAGILALAAGAETGAAVLAGFCALTVLASLLITRAADGARHREKDALAREARMVHQLAAGIQRLRSLGRDEQTAAVAMQVRSEAIAISGALSRNRTLAAAASGELALTGLIVVLGNAAAITPTIAIAAAISLIGAVWLGDAIARAMSELPSFQHFAALCAQPVETGEAIPAADAPIVAEDVCYRHQGLPVLRDVRMTVEPGEITVLAGASGSGKSTLLNILLGAEPPASGEVRYGRSALGDLNLTEWRARIGAVFQNDQVETAGTIRSQLAGAEPVSISTAWRLLEQVELAHEVGAMPMGLQTIVDSNQISTGQQQRLLIARELSAGPEILVLDEAMNAVPDAVQARLIANFRKLGLTCLIVTHRASTIALADRVVVLERGVVVHDGPPGPALARADFQNDLTAEHVLPS